MGSHSSLIDDVKKTEVVDLEAGTSDPGFDLKYHASECGIKLKEYVVITGYKNAVYNIDGFVKDLPDLNTNRGAHGCGHYVNKDMELVYLVTGGWIGDYVSSTELLIEGAPEWTIAGDLPTG